MMKREDTRLLTVTVLLLLAANLISLESTDDLTGQRNLSLPYNSSTEPPTDYVPAATSSTSCPDVTGSESGSGSPSNDVTSNYRPDETSSGSYVVDATPATGVSETNHSGTKDAKDVTAVSTKDASDATKMTSPRLTYSSTEHDVTSRAVTVTSASSDISSRKTSSSWPDTYSTTKYDVTPGTDTSTSTPTDVTDKKTSSSWWPDTYSSTMYDVTSGTDTSTSTPTDVTDRKTSSSSWPDTYSSTMYDVTSRTTNSNGQTSVYPRETPSPYPKPVPGSLVMSEVRRGHFHVNLSICDPFKLGQRFSSNTLEATHNGVFEASGDPSHSRLFVCAFELVAGEEKFLAIVLEAYRIESREEQEQGEALEMVLVIRDNSKTKPSESIVAVWEHYEKDAFANAFVVASRSNKLIFTMQTSDRRVKSVFLRFRFIVTSIPALNILENEQVSPRAGFITSFAFDGYTRYATNTTALYLLQMSMTDGALITFPHLDLHNDPACRTDKIMLRQRHRPVGLGTYWWEWTKCGREDIPPMMYFKPIAIHLLTQLRASVGTGFKMLYSIHSLSKMPQQLANGLFNCSDSQHYDTFRLHFDCNLKTECAEGEDERHCFYTSSTCGAGSIDAGDKCYRYVTVEKEISWYDAYEKCRDLGERLVSPQTFGEWETFKSIIERSSKTHALFVGLTTSSSSLHHMYGEVWQWVDQTMAFYVNIDGQKLAKPTCAHIPPIFRDMLRPTSCGTPEYVHYLLCERSKLSGNSTQIHLPNTSLAEPPTKWKLTQCPAGHVTRDFLSCDVNAGCGVSTYMTSCRIPNGTRDVAMFECDSGSQTLHYSLVCDHIPDCFDGSDENFCVHGTCPERRCRNQQCVSHDSWCDGMQHCVDGSDEECLQIVLRAAPSIPPPAVVSLDGHGGYTIRALNSDEACPVTHFRCPRDYCLPVYLRCNGVFDCPGHEDEADCESYTCPGFYRCRGSRVCIHVDHVCDGVFHCPQQDDELHCNVTCPLGCHCQGLAFNCYVKFPADAHAELRYLDASGSGMTPGDLKSNVFLIRLSLSACGLVTVTNMTFPNLKWLDLSNNALTSVDMQVVVGLRNLRVLRLAGNPLVSLAPAGGLERHMNLHTLDLSYTELDTYSGRVLKAFSQIKILNISYGTLQTITADGLRSTPGLEVLDVSHSPLDEFPRYLLTDLPFVHTVYAGTFKLCCPAVLPENFNPNNCYAPVDEISSCEDLLRDNTYRRLLWLMAIVAIVGNVGSFALRVVQGEALKSSFNVFVTNLCLADFLMGVYLTLIGAAGLKYHGHYVWYDREWKTSVACVVARFLVFLSSEVSAFFICLITLDRFLVIRFPLSLVRFRKSSALVTSAAVWVVGFIISVVPQVPMTSDWGLTGPLGICIPSPISRETYPASQAYLFAVMVVLNFVLFVLIAVGQILIFQSVRRNSLSSQRNRDATIARRLTTVVLSDFLCWFPIGLVGILVSAGFAISDEIRVGMAILVLPFNSALNPFLYTLNVIMEKRKKAAELRSLQQLCQRIGLSLDLEKRINASNSGSHSFKAESPHGKAAVKKSATVTHGRHHPPKTCNHTKPKGPSTLSASTQTENANQYNSTLRHSPKQITSTGDHSLISSHTKESVLTLFTECLDAGMLTADDVVSLLAFTATAKRPDKGIEKSDFVDSSPAGDIASLNL